MASRLFIKAAAAAAVIWALLAAAVVSTGSAHPFNNGYSELRLEQESVSYRLFLAAAALPFLDTDSNGEISESELRSGRTKLEDYVTARLTVENGDEVMDAQFLDAQPLVKEDVPGVSMDLLFRSVEPLQSLLIHYNLLFDDIDPSHLNFVTILNGSRTDQYLFEDSDRTYSMELHNGPANVVWTYFKLGVKHIFTGTDHLVFLLSLLLVAARWRDALVIVTAFTLSHSITLIAAAAGYLPVNPRLVEAGIALTICYTAAENPFIRRFRGRWVTALLLGLVHGLGFAGALGETGLPVAWRLTSLLSFNLGVEAGQIMLVAAALPLLLSLRRYGWYYRAVVVGGSACIFVLGFYWLLVRMGWLAGL